MISLMICCDILGGIMLNKSSKEPLYLQLYNIFKSKIDNGILEVGWQLPSENTLSEDYGVSRATVRQTLSELEKQGYIYKERGKGSFVSIRPFQQDLDNFYNFSDEIKKYGKVPKYSLISFEKVKASEEIQKVMKLGEDSIVYKFEIIRKIENEPILFETTYLPIERFEDFQEENLDKKALYKILKNEYAVKFTEAEQTFYPILADKSIIEYFGVDSPIACMKVERISYEGERVVEYTIAIVKGEKFRYKVKLEVQGTVR